MKKTRSRQLRDSSNSYYRARYYDPSAGRFLSEDPIGFESGDANFYRYVFNNPIRYNDPSGNGIWDFFDDVDDAADKQESWLDYLELVRKYAQCKIDPSKCGKDPAEDPVDPKDFDPNEEPQNMCPVK